MFDFLKLVDRKKVAAIIILGLISGLMSFLFLAFINLMTGLVLQRKNTSDINYIILFFVLMILLIWSKRVLAYIIIKFSQRMFWKLRSHVLDVILKADFYQFSKHKDMIQAVLVNDVNVLTSFSLSIIQFLSAFIVTLGCFIYMGILSKILLLLTLGVSVFAITLYWIGVYVNKKSFAVARELENNFMRNFLDILAGFKEIHMNPKIGDEIYKRKILGIAHESYINNIKAFSGFLNLQITSEVAFNTLIAFILIFSSFFINETPGTMVNFVFILLYLLGSINTLMFVIPGLIQARISSDKIYKLKSALSDDRFLNQMEETKISINDFVDLRVTDLTFSYEKSKKDDENNEKFSIGPVSLSLKKGEVIFIYGGNGSGKTTLINAILGVLRSDSGVIEFNGKQLSPDNYADYRTVFSPVFNDFHLFNELYGFDEISEAEINYFLEMFELTEKVSFKNNSFSSKNLSTGQRKRLGLITALMRKNPVLILDEWAADQDPVFRKKFYTQIIPQLKSMEFSIIAITHDDSYYDVADKLYKIESGILTPELSDKTLKKQILHDQK
jgi:putative ATP-binding cassette transporter